VNGLRHAASLARFPTAAKRNPWAGLDRLIRQRAADHLAPAGGTAHTQRPAGDAAGSR
jgi:hypothetical protein